MQIHLTGKGVLISLLVLLMVLAVLGVVWLISPPWAIAIGLVLLVLVKGLFALLKPSE
ncbi:hypothetical protein [Saccharomonospora xinjiangensis]|uniref:Uncharacterized protein n=1 Tax=Saccharomonospora xinjiangensis XJ-54 TaxID=882086 RepID=I0V4S3_9PSEU|nr:hypothetical protein [Saccharomonospora xinjiangensis]EID55126.1 hypothetical protein SacxiDRAFT_2913 [Saccharomonospora xinjiangensis XJ-54]